MKRAPTRRGRRPTMARHCRHTLKCRCALTAGVSDVFRLLRPSDAGSMYVPLATLSPSWSGCRSMSAVGRLELEVGSWDRSWGVGNLELSGSAQRGYMAIGDAH